MEDKVPELWNPPTKNRGTTERIKINSNQDLGDTKSQDGLFYIMIRGSLNVGRYHGIWDDGSPWISVRTFGALSTIHWTVRALPAISPNSRFGSEDLINVAAFRD